MQKEVKSYKLKTLPNNPIPNAVLYVKADMDTSVSMYITDCNGIPYPLTDEGTGTSGIQTIINTDGTISVLGTDNTVLNLSTSIKNIINSALQPGANISELINDQNYITLADIPSQVVDLQATPSATNVVITNTAGTDATILAATTTNTGVLLPSDKIKLDNITNINTGDQTSIVGIAGTKTEYNTSLTDGDFLFVGDVIATPDATTTTKGIVKLAGDLGGTADLPTVPGLATKAIDTDVIHKNSNPETKTGGFTSGGITNTYPLDNWIAMGTSVTFGGVYTTPMSLQLNLIVTNLGVSGSTSNDLINHYASIPMLNSGNENSYRLVSIEHSINDASQDVPLATFRTNIENAIAHIKGKNWPNNKILIINGNYCSSAPLIPVQEAYANEAILIAKEQGVQYSDIYNYTKNNGGASLLADGVHPTTAGGEVYARGVIASMQGGGEFTNGLTVVNGIVASKIKTYSDSFVNGITVGKGTANTVNSTALGFEVLLANTSSGVRNTGTGYQVLKANTTGINNTGNGYRSLTANTTGSENTGEGYQALTSNTTGNRNTATGTNALNFNTSGSDNVADGYQALINNTTGIDNTANGYRALYSNTTGSENVADGREALLNNIAGVQNTAIGTGAGRYFGTNSALTNPSFSLFIGRLSKALANDGVNEIVIGYNAAGNGSNTFTAGNNSIIATFLKGLVSLPSAKISNTPTTSAGTYEILTRNTVAGVNLGNVEKVLSTSFAPNILTGFTPTTGTIAGTDTVLQGMQKNAGNLVLKAGLSSPVFTGTPAAPTATAGTNTTQLATTAFVSGAINTDVNVQKLADNSIKTVSFADGSAFNFFPGADYEKGFFVKINGESDFTNSVLTMDSQEVSLFSTGISGDVTSNVRLNQGDLELSSYNNVGGSGGINFRMTPVGIGIETLLSGPAYSYTNFPTLGAGTFTVAMQPVEYTVSALPTPTGDENRFAIVTDATSPTYLSILTGGGSVVCPVFYNGAVWVSMLNTSNVSPSTKTANYTTLLTDETILVDATSGNITITLLNAIGNSGKKFTVKKIDSSVNTVTISNSAGIDGTTTKVYSTQDSGGTFQSNGTQYYITGNF